MKIVVKYQHKGRYRFDLSQFYYCSHANHYCKFEKDCSSDVLVYIFEKNDLFMCRLEYGLSLEAL